MRLLPAFTRLAVGATSFRHHLSSFYSQLDYNTFFLSYFPACINVHHEPHPQTYKCVCYLYLSEFSLGSTQLWGYVA